MKLKNYIPDFMRVLFNPPQHSDVAVQPKTRDQLHQWWRNPRKGNLPEEYMSVAGDVRSIRRDLRSRFLVETVNKHLPEEARILELGCNVGRNLEYLFSSGFQNLSAVEINENAIKLMKERYPDMASKSVIYRGTIEDQIMKFQDSRGLTS